jgi:uncharacterized BrkB/YihY/UPF0761 family membrane protein
VPVSSALGCSMRSYSVIDRLLLATGVLLPFTAALYIAVATPEFAAVFSSTEYEPPLATRLLFKLYLFGFLSPAVVFGIWRYCPPNKIRPLVCLAVGIMLSAALLMFFYWAIYLPIHDLPSTK